MPPPAAGGHADEPLQQRRQQRPFRNPDVHRHTRSALGLPPGSRGRAVPAGGVGQRRQDSAHLVTGLDLVALVVEDDGVLVDADSGAAGLRRALRHDARATKAGLR